MDIGMDIGGIIAIVISSVVALYVAILRYRGNKISATEEIASGAQILVQMSRAEWEAERAKRIALERKLEIIQAQLKEFKQTNEQLRTRVRKLEAAKNKALEVALVFYKQLTDNQIEPLMTPEGAKDRKSWNIT